MNDEQRRLFDWATGDDTGASSMCIARFMLGLESSVWQRHWSPSDADDRGRCKRLLDLIPTWWERLDEMRTLSEDWNKQIDILKQERASHNQ